MYTHTSILPSPLSDHPSHNTLSPHSYGDATGQRREQFSVSALSLLGERAAATPGDDKAKATANAAFHNHLLKRLRWVS